MTTTPSAANVVTTVDQLRKAIIPLRRAGKRIGLVPTMGALHEGHLSLVRTSQAECDRTVVTIFVNPTQFGPKEDFAKYPRTLEKDLAALATCGPVLVFAPTVEAMYPAGFSSWVEVGVVAEPLEGQFRPGHFRGVATVVMKLFQMVGADVAYFGQKDYQQTLVIRRMVGDLNVPITVQVCPTVREADGLAKSSRNVYLDPQARERAAGSLEEPVPGPGSGPPRPARRGRDPGRDGESDPHGRRCPDRLRCTGRRRDHGPGPRDSRAHRGGLGGPYRRHATDR